MESSFLETLAALLESGDRGLLTTLDGGGREHTSPVRSLRTPFTGHLWLDTGSERIPARNIGDGSEVTLAFGDAFAGPYVTVSGWAVVLVESETARADTGHRFAGARAAAGESKPLLCVTARAAELWENGARQRGRVFAFAPSGIDHTADRPTGRQGWATARRPVPVEDLSALAATP